MKLKRHITTLLIAMMLALSGLYAQTIVGYSSLFTFDTRNTNLDFIGYSGLFTFDTRNIIPDLFIEYLNITGGADTCFEALQTIVVTDLTVEPGNRLNLVAGEMINIQAQSYIESGAQFWAFIDTTGQFCSISKSLIAAFDIENERTGYNQYLSKERSFFSLFPNPTAGTFTLQLNDAEETTAITVDIYSLIGELIVQTQFAGKQKYEFDLRGRPDGVYLIRVLRGKEVGVDKLIKQ